MTRLELAAVNWWRHRRPLSFTQADHLRNPGINLCTASEYRLAIEVAKRLRKRKKT